MKHNWQIRKLGELVTTINGLWKGKKPPFVNVAVIRNTNFSKECQLKLDDVEYLDVEEKQFKTRQLHMGDIIIEKSGGSEKQPVGRPILFNIQNDNYSFSNFTSTLRINNQKEICPTFLQQYLYHRWLEGDTKSLQSHTTGIHNLDFKGFLNFDIPVPPLEEQKRIVAVLDKKFAQIETLKTAAEKNLQNTKQLFQAELEKAFSNTSWEKKKLMEICQVINGYAFPSKDFSNKNLVKSIKITNVGVGLFVEDDTEKLPKCYLDSRKDVLVNTGDIVIALTRTIISDGLKVAFVPESFNEALVNQRVADLRANQSMIYPTFLFLFFRTGIAYKYVLEHVNTLMQPNLSISDLKDFPIPLPPLEEQKRIVKELDSLSEKVRQLQEIYTKQIANCDELKQAYLQKAFEGEL